MVWNFYGLLLWMIGDRWNARLYWKSEQRMRCSFRAYRYYNFAK